MERLGVDLRGERGGTVGVDAHRSAPGEALPWHEVVEEVDCDVVVGGRTTRNRFTTFGCHAGPPRSAMGVWSTSSNTVALWIPAARMSSDSAGSDTARASCMVATRMVNSPSAVLRAAEGSLGERCAAMTSTMDVIPSV